MQFSKLRDELPTEKSATRSVIDQLYHLLGKFGLANFAFVKFAMAARGRPAAVTHSPHQMGDSSQVAQIGKEIAAIYERAHEICFTLSISTLAIGDTVRGGHLAINQRGSARPSLTTTRSSADASCRASDFSLDRGPRAVPIPEMRRDGSKQPRRRTGGSLPRCESLRIAKCGRPNYCGRPHCRT